MRANIPMTSNQKSAMLKEIKRQCVENLKQYDIDYYSIIAYTLNKEFGFGKDRLVKFINAMAKGKEELEKYYLCEADGDYPYIAMKEYLSRKGINVKQILDDIDKKGE